MNPTKFIKNFQYALGIYCEFHLNSYFNGFYLADSKNVHMFFGDNKHLCITIAHINMVLNHGNTIGRCSDKEREIIKWWNVECINSTGDEIK